MSTIHPRARHHVWLLCLIIVEIVTLLGLATWAIMRPDPVVQTAVTATPKVVHAPTLGVATYATGLSAPVGIVNTGSRSDKRLFIVEQAGTIRMVGGDGKTVATPFLDITAKVQFNNEMGLLGLAFDPDYEVNGYFYVNYVDKQRNTIIARYHATNATTADAKSEKVLLSIKQPYENHNGGDLAFGPDGYLYIALGDGGNSGDPENRAQDKNVLLGKLLRIDVSKGEPYSIPPTNPFAKEAGTRPEIWAYGLRNPWRISFDRDTHDLYIADVGQGLYEEIDVQASNSKGGENYGWRCYEGAHTFKDTGCKTATAYTSPVLEYNHDENRCSITGGYVYRGSETQLNGKYFYADYCGGQIYFAEKKNGTWIATLAMQTTHKISTFGEDSTDELYFADVADGNIYRLSDTANN